MLTDAKIGDFSFSFLTLVFFSSYPIFRSVFVLYRGSSRRANGGPNADGRAAMGDVGARGSVSRWTSLQGLQIQKGIVVPIIVDFR